MTLCTLYEEFERNYMAQRLRPSTIRGYRVNIEKHVLPLLGALDLDEVLADTLDGLTNALKPKLGNRSIAYVHATLRKMLNYALRRGYITRNPSAMFDLPRVERYRYRTLYGGEISRLLTLTRSTPLEVPVTLALCYGLRRGECLGVIPALDLDPYARVLHVQRTRSVERGATVVTPCKTDRSNRRILLAESHVELLKGLMQSEGDFACPLSPNALEWQFKAMLRKHGFPAIRFHDLRHSYATFMLAQDVNPKIVSTVLGHSGVAITLDIYSHPNLRMQETCLRALAGL